MKYTKKLLSLVLVLVLALALAVPGLAVTGAGGKIQIDNATAETTYYAYKIFDAQLDNAAEPNAISYTISSTDKWYNVVSAADSPFMLTRQDSATDLYYVSLKDAGTTGKTIADYLTTHKGEIENDYEETAHSSKLTINVNYGYYLVMTSAAEATVSVDSTNPVANIVDKNQTPTWEDGDKKVSDVAGSYGTMTSVNLGETVYFEVTLGKAVNFDGANPITKYTFTDNLGNGAFELDPSTFVVKVNGVTLSKDESDYTGTVTPTTIDIEIPWSVDANDNGVMETDEFFYQIPEGKDASEIVVTYAAKLVSIDDNGKATNQAKFGYNETELDPKDAEVETYKIEIDKIDGKSHATLMGAEFTLYKTRTGNEGNYQYSDPVKFDTVVTTGEGSYTGTYTYKADGNVTSIKSTGSVNIEGVPTDVYQHIVLKGLEAGTYYLVETKAPEGYNLLANAEVITLDHSNAVKDLDVINNIGTELPGTGGMGTTIFYTLGGVLVVGAAILLVTKKRVHDVEG